jgi:ABC-type transporter Mla subunit MlaD
MPSSPRHELSQAIDQVNVRLDVIERHLESIMRKLRSIAHDERIIMADQAALDSAIATLQTAVDAIVAKIGTVPNVDFQPEIDMLAKATDEINAALAPPASVEPPA